MEVINWHRLKNDERSEDERRINYLEAVRESRMFSKAFSPFQEIKHYNTELSLT